MKRLKIGMVFIHLKGEITMLPLHIDVKGKQVVVVGGGSIALRRLTLFLKEGACITVVSPHVINGIEELYHNKQLQWVNKKVELADLESAFIIIAATNDPSLNEWISKHANKNQLVNVVSNVEQGNFLVPKSIKKGRLSLSVSTNGASPKLAKEICEQLSIQFDESFIQELDELYEQRLKKKRNK
jgi:precorrin-2 dehydrogenase / sirohydrochlorin ferrochelatase